MFMFFLKKTHNIDTFFCDLQLTVSLSFLFLIPFPRNSFIDILRAILLSLEVLIEDQELQINGFILIIDWSNFSFKQASKLTPSILKLAIEGLQVCVDQEKHAYAPLNHMILMLSGRITFHSGYARKRKNQSENLLNIMQLQFVQNTRHLFAYFIQILSCSQNRDVLLTTVVKNNVQRFEV